MSLSALIFLTGSLHERFQHFIESPGIQYGGSKQAARKGEIDKGDTYTTKVDGRIFVPSAFYLLLLSCPHLPAICSFFAAFLFPRNCGEGTLQLCGSKIVLSKKQKSAAWKSFISGKNHCRTA